MRMEAMIPLLDMTCLTVGVLLVAMTEMQRVTTVPVDFVKVARDASVVKRVDSPLFVAMSGDGVFVEKRRVRPEELRGLVAGRAIVLRVDSRIPYGEAMRLVGDMREVTKSIFLEVRNE